MHVRVWLFMCLLERSYAHDYARPVFCIGPAASLSDSKITVGRGPEQLEPWEVDYNRVSGTRRVSWLRTMFTSSFSLSAAWTRTYETNLEALDQTSGKPLQDSSARLALGSLKPLVWPRNARCHCPAAAKALRALFRQMASDSKWAMPVCTGIWVTPGKKEKNRCRVQRPVILWMDGILHHLRNHGKPLVVGIYMVS